MLFSETRQQYERINSEDGVVPVKPKGVAIDVTIPDDESSLSGVADLQGISLYGLYVPENHTSEALMILVSDNPNGVFVPLITATGAIIVTLFMPGMAHSLAPFALDLAPWRYIKIMACDTEGSPVQLLTPSVIKLVGKA